jgi:hypothetical protein
MYLFSLIRGCSMSIKLPAMPEAAHPLVQPWLDTTDTELLQLIQQHPDQGRYFTALFCRYGTFVYTLLSQHAKVSLQADYIFARTWRKVFLALTQPVNHPELDIQGIDPLSWISDQAAATIRQEPLPAIESIHYSLSAAPPPLWCYLEAALDQMPATTRLIMVMDQTFHWNTDRIMAYFESEGEILSFREVQEYLEQGYKILEVSLPEDISEIYLTSFAATGMPSRIHA